MSDNTRMLTPQARMAAVETRRRMYEAKQPPGAPQSFVVRMEGSAQPFGWEIRKFGSFVVSRSETCFATQLEARTAGEIALAALTLV